MNETLYRKYRPQTFADLVGQRHIRLTLEHALERQRLAQTYIFTGPRGVGKTTTARLLARAVNCTKRGKAIEPCNECPACRSILDHKTLDVVEIDAASQTGVDNVREHIIQSAHAVPAQLGTKVFIIDEVHMLSMAAFNALLKLLEEPPNRTLFILATTEPHRIPETILSRGQRFDFKRIPLLDMVGRLRLLAQQEKRTLADGVAERIARQAGGSLRDAETLLGQLFTIGEGEVTTETADALLPRSDHRVTMTIVSAAVDRRGPDALQHFWKYIEDGGDVTALLTGLIDLARAVMVSTVDPALMTTAVATLDEHDQQELLDIAKRTAPDEMTRLVDILLIAHRQIGTTEPEELPVEIALLRICYPETPVAPLTSRPAPTRLTSTLSAPQAASTPLPHKTSITPTPAEPTLTVPDTDPPDRPKAQAKTKKINVGTLALQKVEEAWHLMTTAIASTSPGLALSLKQAVLVGADDGQVTVALPHSIHVDRVNHERNARVIRESLAEHLGLDVQVSAIHDPGVARELPPPPPDTSPSMMSAIPVAHSSSPPPPRPSYSKRPATRQGPATSGNDLWDQMVSSFS